MKRIWKAKQKFSDNLLEQLLAARGLKTPEEVEFFWEPEYEQTHDPFLLTDMEKAVERIKKALENQEKITIFADYDADAVTAAATLLRFFQHVGCQNVDYYIPDRFTEGYGVNAEAVKALAQAGSNLIITVDCGISAFEAADIAARLGVDLIITDHHKLTSHETPKAVAVINPHRPDDRYPFKDLTGVGVAFKLVQAIQTVIASEAKQSQRQEIASSPPEADPRNDNPEWIKWLLDLVAIGTVADCQSLLGENRIFVKWGIYVLQKTRWPGLKKLLEIAGISSTELDTYKIGFMIAPRINAAGRIEHANLALELLLTDDLSQALELSSRLNKLNRERQDLTEQILSEAREQILQISHQKILLAAGSGWPRGVVGLVAGKLSEEFHRPVLVLDKGKEETVGSARSIARFDIIEAIGQNKDILVKYGGHSMAAGFTLRSEHIEIFHKNLIQYAETVLTEEDLSPILYYDAEVTLDKITEELIQDLEKFAPFGQDNPKPRLRINNLSILSFSAIGQDEQHLRLVIEKNGGSFGCIGFNQGFWEKKLNSKARVDLVCEPQFNEWNNERKIQLKIIDIDFSIQQ